jgi:tetratricopeptide (TPR) repeat protein
VASLLNVLGRVSYAEGDYARARSLHQESVAVSGSSVERRLVAGFLRDLAAAARAQGDLEEAWGRLTESLSIERLAPHRLGVAQCLERLAPVLAAQGHAERAARLLGAAGAIREEIQAALAPIERDGYERGRALVREALGEEAFAAAWAAGRAMTLEEAVAYAQKVP